MADSSSVTRVRRFNWTTRVPRTHWARSLSGVQTITCSTHASRAAARDACVEHVIVCTPDKDLAQCVRGTRVVQLNRRTRVTLDESAIVTKFGLSPASILDYPAPV